MLPRRVIPGTTYLITRRCTQRQFLMAPSAKVNRVILFCLARGALLYGIQLHAYCFLSSHYHVGLTDPHGNICKFAEWVNKHIARCLNLHHDRSENFFDSRRGSYVELVSPRDALEKLVYTLANPVSSGLVAKGEQWPGLRSAPGGYTREIEVEKPEIFFRPGGRIPDKLRFRLVPPPGFDDPEEFGRELAARVEEQERKIRQQFRQEGRRFLGARACKRVKPTDSARSSARPGGLSPRIAAKDRRRRVEALRALRKFWNDYRAAIAAYLGGRRDVLFPAGTYKMRLEHGVRCEPFPPPAIARGV